MNERKLDKILRKILGTSLIILGVVLIIDGGIIVPILCIVVGIYIAREDH